MFGPPRLWSHLMREVVPLPASLGWTFWRAIVRAQWAKSTAWREAFLTLSRHAVLTEDLVTGVHALVTLDRLIALIEALMAEKTLLRRDGRLIEEALFARADAHGQLHPPQGRQGTATTL